MVKANALDLICGLPQAQHFPDSRVIGYLQHLQMLGEDTLWHANRLGGFGGSEMGALLRHRFGDFAELPDDSFKSAWEVVAEKLLRIFPRRSTDQALRGRELEPLARDAFRLRHRAEPDDANLARTQQHSTIECLRGSVDDLVIVNGARLLPDYKTSQLPYSAVPFDYRVQALTYAGICNSNGLKIDRALIVGLHAPESVLTGLRQVVANRHDDPNIYRRWVETLAFASVPGIELRTYSLKYNQDLVHAIENTAEYYWNEYVLRGRLIALPQTKQIPDSILPEIEHHLARAAQAIAVSKAAEEVQTVSTAAIVDLLGKAEIPLQLAKWPKSVGAPRVTVNFDQSKGIAAAMANDIDPSTYSTQAVSIELLKAKFVELGGDLDDDSLKESSVDRNRLMAALARADIDVKALQRPTFGITLSRAGGAKDAVAAMKADWEERIATLTTSAAILDTAPNEDLAEDIEESQASPVHHPA